MEKFVFSPESPLKLESTRVFSTAVPDISIIPRDCYFSSRITILLNSNLDFLCLIKSSTFIFYQTNSKNVPSYVLTLRAF